MPAIFAMPNWSNKIVQQNILWPAGISRCLVSISTDSVLNIVSGMTSLPALPTGDLMFEVLNFVTEESKKNCCFPLVF